MAREGGVRLVDYQICLCNRVIRFSTFGSIGGHQLTSAVYGAKTLSEVDAVVITTGHRAFDPEFILENAKLVVDLQNVITGENDKVYKL
jgi:UDP-N-acetyl-D-mannosaminuronate dehydrogenase